MIKDSNRRRDNPRIRLPLWGVALLALFIAVLLIASTLWVFNTVRDISSSLDTQPPAFEEGGSQGGSDDFWENLGDPLVTPGAQEVDGGGGLSIDALQPWSGKERVTVLVLGIDLRCDEEGPTHTDSMMVLTMDPVGLSAAALSLPTRLVGRDPQLRSQ